MQRTPDGEGFARIVGRRASPEHESRWLNLVGFALRPGRGAPLDDWRVKQLWRVFNAGLAHEKDEACRLSWWIVWRRGSSRRSSRWCSSPGSVAAAR